MIGKRRAAALTLLATVAAVAVPGWRSAHHDTTAAPSRHGAAKLISAPSSREQALRGIELKAPARARRPTSQIRPLSVTSATGLAVPWALWPASTTRQVEGAATATYVDGGGNLMLFVHSKTYASFGFQGAGFNVIENASLIAGGAVAGGRVVADRLGLQRAIGARG